MPKEKTKSASGLSEHAIQRQILHYLSYRGIPHMRLNTAAVSADYKGKRRFFRSAPAGCPDIVACSAGTFLAIEVKKPGGRQSEAQKLWQENWCRAGVNYILAYSLSDVIMAL